MARDCGYRASSNPQGDGGFFAMRSDWVLLQASHRPSVRSALDRRLQPGESNHSLRCAPVSACQARFSRASFSTPEGILSARSRSALACFVNLSSSVSVWITRRRICPRLPLVRFLPRRDSMHDGYVRFPCPFEIFNPLAEIGQTG